MQLFTSQTSDICTGQNAFYHRMGNTVSITIGLLAVTAIAIWCFIRRTYTYWERRGVPTLPSTIPFGHFGNVGTTTSHAELMQSVYEAMKDSGTPFCGVYSFHRPLALILDRTLMRRVLVTDFSTFHDRGSYHNAKADPLSANLITIEGQQWRDLRRKFTAIFSSGKMRQMFGAVDAVADQLVQVVNERLQNDGRLEMRDLLASYTTDAIGVCGFGLECNSMHDANVEFRRMGKRVFDNPRNSPAYQLFISSFQGLARFLGCRVVSEEVEQFYMEVIRKTVAYREENNVKRNDLLDVLLELKDNGFGLTIEQITAEAFAFFLAGFGTTSTMMAFAMYELALNEDMQQKLRDEIYAVLERHDGKLTYESVTDMKYLNQVFDGKCPISWVSVHSITIVVCRIIAQISAIRQSHTHRAQRLSRSRHRSHP